MTLLSRFVENVELRPKAQAVIYIKKRQTYHLNWQQVFDFCENYFFGLKKLGVRKGDSVALYSDTCKEWGFLDISLLALGAKTVPLYHSSNTEDVDFILKDCQAEVVIVENETLLKKLQKTSAYKDQVKKIVMIHPLSTKDERVLSLQDLVTSDHSGDFKQACQDVQLKDEATIIYTSGTSGTPKGVLLSHQQIYSGVSDVFPLLGVTHNDVTLTFLPFSHVLGRMELWGSYFCGYTLGYAESVDRIRRNLPQIQPTVIVGVPRIFEKIYYGIQAQVEISETRLKIFNQALQVGMEMAQCRREHRAPSMALALKYQLARRLVLKNIANKLGGRLRFAISGGAPLDPEIARFFEACGLPILEGYGLTETTGPVFVNTLFESRLGRVGKAIGDTKVRFAEDGEILVHGKKVMVGYYNSPEASRDAFTEDHYFRTGDIGELDEDGFLKITDRKKDLIKTAGGKFIAPQKLQQLFSIFPLIGHVHIHGDKRKYVVALITLERDSLLDFAKKHNIKDDDYNSLCKNPLVEKRVREIVAEVNQQLASFETIKRYIVLDHEFTVENGTLTPSLKMKRKVIDERYMDELDSLYL
ncbi:MAG: long-chain fatty acid--CoA ligase [Bdellovibrionales bacterium]|nr:long-chain fatty acid--CoA ligase [Bdellovibrionales bacterium]